MATITRLIVQVGADTNNLRQNLDRGLGYLRQFAKTTADIGKRSNIFGNIDVASAKSVVEIAERTAKAAAEQSFRTINQTYVNGINNLREKLVRGGPGGINQDQFAQQARVLGRAFNNSLVDELDKLAAQGLLTERVRAGMMTQFKDLGDEAGKAIRERLIQGLQLEQNVGRKLVVGLTLPIVAGFTLAAKSAAEFENNMLRVGSLLDATVPEFRALESAARDFSSVVQFGIVPSEAAKGMQILAQAGFTVREVMDILPTSLKLAAVEQTDLANATNIATSVMTAFRIESGGAAAAADVLARASIDSKASLTDLGFSFTYVGGVARSVGLEFHETTAALALMAEEGFRGTLAGTALRGAILKLTSPTVEQARIFRKLGIETVNAEGKLLNLASIIKQFEDAEKTFGAFRVGADILKLFGQRAGPGFGALIRQGSEEFVKFQVNLENSAGTLDRIARAQVSGLTGAFKQLISSIQILAIAILKSGLIEWLTAIVRGIASAVQWFSQLSPAVLKVVTILGLMAAALGPLVVLISAVKIAIVGFGAAGIGLGAILAPSGAIIIGLGLLAAAIIIINEHLNRGQKGIEEYVSALGLLNKEQAFNQKIFEAKELAKLQNEQIGLSRALRAEARRARMVKAPQGAFPVPTERFKALSEQFRQNEVAVLRYKTRIKELNTVITGHANSTSKMKQAGKDALDVLNELIARSEDGLFAGGDAAGKKTIIDLLLEQMELASAKMKALQIIGQQTVGINLVEGGFGTAAASRELNIIGDIYSTILRMVKDKILLNKADLSDLKGLEEAANNYRKALGLQDTVALKERLKIDVPLFDDKEITSKFKILEGLAERIRALTFQQTLAEQGQNQAMSEQLRKRIEENRKVLQAMITAFSALMSGKNLSPAAQAKLFEDLKAALAGTGVEILDNEAKQKKWNKSVDLAQRSFRQLTKVAKGLEVIDRELRAAAEGMQVAVDGAQQLAKALSDAKKSGGKIDLTLALSGGAAIVGGILGALGGILGGDDETKRIIADNNEELSRLRGELSKNRLEGLAGIDKLSKFLSNVSITQDIRGIRVLNKVTGEDDITKRHGKAIGFIEELARQFGLTFDQIKAIAEQQNITIVKDGKLVIEGFKALQESLRLTSDALRQFSNTIDIQRTLIETERKLKGISDTPETNLEDSLAILKNAAPALFEFIGSITDVTAETAPAIREALLRLIAAIKAGEISAEQFGQFGSADEFLQFLADMANGLLDLEGASNSAADSLRNVPSVLKLERLRFQSQFTTEMDKRFKDQNKITIDTPAADLSTVAAKLDSMLKSSPPDLINGLKNIHDAILNLSRNTDSITRDGTDTGGTTVHIHVDSSDLRTRENASVLGDRVVEGFRRKSQVKYGTSVRIGDI